MLDERKVKEAEENVRSYLNEGLLKKAGGNKQIESIFLRNGKESIRVAEEIYQKNLSDLWVIVCSYYSMYYYSNAVLVRLGYKVGEKIVHKVTLDALIVFVRGKLKASLLDEYDDIRSEALRIAGVKADGLIESFELERKKRGMIQYQTQESEKHSKAKTSLDRAKEFNREMEKLLA